MPCRRRAEVCMKRAALTLCFLSFAMSMSSVAQTPGGTARDRVAFAWTSAFFTTSDGIRIHYLEAGKGPAIFFIPGWTMPAVTRGNWQAPVCTDCHGIHGI